jgi:hypothetical protein
LLLISQQDLGHFFTYQPLLPIGLRIVQILHQFQKKTTNTVPTTLGAIQAASHPLFINKQLYSTCYKANLLASTATNTHFLQYKIIGAIKKFKKWSRPLFRPKTNHTGHQTPNPPRETVPLKVIK